MRPIDADELISLVIARGFYGSIETNILNLIDNAPTVKIPQCNQIVWEQGYDAGYMNGYKVGYKDGYSDRSEVGSK